MDTALVSISYQIEHSASELGEHTIALKVTDSIGQVATDTVRVSVLPPTPARRPSRGRIKGLYR